MPSDISISNSALAKIGAERILSLSDDSKAARLCKQQFTPIFNEVLRSHPWNFAIKRVELAKTINTPAFEFTSEFQLPNDCLRVIGTNLLNEDQYSIEGDKVLTNTDALKIRYLSSDIQVGLVDENFAEAMSMRMAADLAYSIKQSIPLGQAWMQAFRLFVGEAKSYDAQEGNTMRKVEANEFINSRF